MIAIDYFLAAAAVSVLVRIITIIVQAYRNETGHRQNAILPVCPVISCGAVPVNFHDYPSRGNHPFFSATISVTPTSFQTMVRSSLTIASGRSSGR